MRGTTCQATDCCLRIRIMSGTTCQATDCCLRIRIMGGTTCQATDCCQRIRIMSGTPCQATDCCLRIRIMSGTTCQATDCCLRTTCQATDCCFSEVALQKSSTNQISLSSLRNATCSRYAKVQKLLNWYKTIITHLVCDVNVTLSLKIQIP